jgi:general secretion pathway protein B
VSFILDALRKSEHERQRSELPGFAQVPVATPAAQLPRWVMIVMAMLVTAVVTLGIAWYRSVQAPTPSPAPLAVAPPRPVATVERRVELPPPPVIDTRASAPQSATLQSAATLTLEPAPSERESSGAAVAAQAPESSLPPAAAVDSDPALPSAAALAAEGVALPPLRLELHAFSDSPANRFVFINGRRYTEGARLPEGPELVSIEPRGAVLRHAGRRFLLVQE